MIKHTDIAIIGGGVIGLATAYNLKKTYPKKSIIVIEKENSLSSHQTGNNSGVIHSGIYYKPGSLKAINCRKGKQALERFCKQEGVNYEQCGKVIVATSENELPAMQKIYERGKANNVTCKKIDKIELNELEPHAAGIAAIHEPEAGIINYKKFVLFSLKKLKPVTGKF